MSKITDAERGTVQRGTETAPRSAASGPGNPGTRVGTETRNGVEYTRYRAKPGTWVSASLVDQGYDSVYSKEAGYGAYRGIVLGADGSPLRTPDRISPGDEYLIPTGSAPPPAVRQGASAPSTPHTSRGPSSGEQSRPPSVGQQRPSAAPAPLDRGTDVAPRRSPPLPHPPTRALENSLRTRRGAVDEPVLVPASPLYTRGTATSKCYTPYPLNGREYADAFGLIAHAFIQQDFVETLRLKRGRSVQIDDSFAGRRNKAFENFLINKNLRNLTPAQKEAIKKYRGQRPDIVLDNGIERGFEEIKSAHESTIERGVEQVEAVARFMQENNLPYPLGTSYEPKSEIPITDFLVLGEVVEVYLCSKRVKGLIAYKYCLRADWARLKGKFKIVVGFLVVILAVLLALAREKVGLPPGPLPDLPKLPDRLPVMPPIEVIIPPDRQPAEVDRLYLLPRPETMTVLQRIPLDLAFIALENGDDIVMEPYVKR